MICMFYGYPHKKKKTKKILEYDTPPMKMTTCIKEHVSARIKEETTLHY